MSTEGPEETQPADSQQDNVAPGGSGDTPPAATPPPSAAVPASAATPPAGAYPPPYSGYPPTGGYPPPPAGFAPGMYPPQSGYAPPPPGYMYPPPGYPPVYPPTPYMPPPAGARAQEAPRVRRPGIGPWPQGIAEMIGTIFRLYGQNFVKLTLLSLLVAFLPALLPGVLAVLALYLVGFDVTQSYFQNLFPGGGFLNNIGAGNLNGYDPNNPQAFQPTTPSLPFMSVTPEQWLLLGIGVVVGFLLLFVLTAWQMGALAIAARDCTLGRPLSIRAALVGGLRRLLPVLGTIVLVGLVFFALFMLLYGALIAYAGIIINSASLDQFGAGRTVLGTLGLMFLGIGVFELLFYVAYIYLLVRLGMAPYIAAADAVSPGRAFARSWSLVRGNWWRTFTPLLVIQLAVGIATSVLLSPGEFAPIFFFFLILLPIIATLSTPLLVVAFVAIYYDLRLRRVGYLPLANEVGLPTSFPPPPGWHFGAMPPPPTGPAQTGQAPAG